MTSDSGSPPYSRRDFLKRAGQAAAALSAVSVLGDLAFAVGARAEENSTVPLNKEAPIPTGTGCLFEDRYIDHLLSEGHPESPERLRAIRRQLQESGLEARLTRLHPGKEDPLSYIRQIHPSRHIELVKKGAKDESICRLAVSGALAAVDAVCTGKVRNAFCAIRPPGHHATDTGEFGFCFYNNVAVAARYAQLAHKVKRILIADWDFHHGNGTEWAFYDDPTVLFFSTHALYAFPGSGDPARTGNGAGEGFNINVPLPHGADDTKIIEAFEKRLVPAADSFKPDLVLVSAGFDARKDDLLGDFAVTDEGFKKITDIVMDIARRHAGSRLVSLLEGGYNTGGLALAVQAHVKALLG